MYLVYIHTHGRLSLMRLNHTFYIPSFSPLQTLIYSFNLSYIEISGWTCGTFYGLSTFQALLARNWILQLLQVSLGGFKKAFVLWLLKTARRLVHCFCGQLLQDGSFHSLSKNPMIHLILLSCSLGRFVHFDDVPRLVHPTRTLFSDHF